MNELTRFELVSPAKMVLAADVREVHVPGGEGDFGLLPGHAPLMTTIRPGILTVITRSGSKKEFYIRGGFAEAGPLSLTILAQHVIDLDKLNTTDLLEEIRKLEDDVEDARDDEERRKAEFQLNRLRELKNVLGL